MLSKFWLFGLFSFQVWTAPAPDPSACPEEQTPQTPQQNGNCYYWLENIQHQGRSAFNPDGNYKVFRNVKTDFGAKGDGVTDDTAAINAAISAGNRCLPGACNSTTTTPALVYFPAGTYLISDRIISHYYTHIIGNPNCLPVIKASANFKFYDWADSWVIDANPYQSDGRPGYLSVNVFWRQIKNLVIDMTAVPATRVLRGIHWNAGQANSLQNIVIKMSTVADTRQTGIFIEDGSGGMVNDIQINGGQYGAWFGSQQFTMRNLTISNAQTAIKQDWDWGWTYAQININNCRVGIEMTGTDGFNVHNVAALTLIDSQISQTPTGLNLLWNIGNNGSVVPGSSVILENVDLTNVPVAIKSQTGTVLAGPSGSQTTNIAGWMQGNSYSPSGHGQYQGPIVPNNRPAELLNGRNYYSRIHPQYEGLNVNQFLSVKSVGARGDGRADDTTAIQTTIDRARASGQVVFFDAGTYRVTRTIYIPAGSKVTGEIFPIVMSSGSFFADINNPQPVFKAGNVGESGVVEWSNTIVSTQGAQAGAILIEWNLRSPAGSPSGMWDVHTRVGGFAGSNLLLANCPKTPNIQTTAENINRNCIAAFASMRVTSSAAGLYMSNVWLWVADHDVEDKDVTQTTIYAGRGLLIESQGPVWLWGTSVEHHVLYEYSFQNAGNIFAGFIQTETAYYQPNPPAPFPFTSLSSWRDPTFTGGASTPSGWGLYIGGTSKDIFVYGAGLYSFFQNYDLRCSNRGNGEWCQRRMFLHEGVGNVGVYGLSTVGVTYMASREVGAGNVQDVAYYGDNLAGFSDSIALYRWNRA